jgi:hypothetical protein
VGQEFIIKSQDLEDKINQLLPSQGGFQAGVDLSASTTIIPIVDLTEQAEGSNVRADLQSAFTHTNANFSSVNNATSTIITTTGYWRLFGISAISVSTSALQSQLLISDGATDKVVFQHDTAVTTATTQISTLPFDFLVKLEAGDSVKAASLNSKVFINVAFRQIATITGTLINT